MTRGLENAIQDYKYRKEGLVGFVDTEDTNEENFSMFITVDTSNPNMIECPVFMIGHFLRAFFPCNEQPINKIVAPININDNSGCVYKTVDSLFRDFFARNTWEFKKSKFKDNVVYGNRGIIFNDKYEILYCETMLIDCVYFKGISENIYIHPNVYKDNKNIINKGIMSRLVPYYIGEYHPSIPFGLADSFVFPNPLPCVVIFKDLPILKVERCLSDSIDPQEILQNNKQVLSNSIGYAI